MTAFLKKFVFILYYTFNIALEYTDKSDELWFEAFIVYELHLE